MVNAENISTFAKLIHIVQYILKQMILKYFYRTLGILLWVFVMASCLSSNTNEINDKEMTKQLSGFKDDLIKNGKEFKDNLLTEENVEFVRGFVSNEFEEEEATVYFESGMIAIVLSQD